MFQAKVNDKHEFKVTPGEDGFLLNGEAREADILRLDDHTFQVLYTGRAIMVHVLRVDREGKIVELKVNGKRATVALSTEMDLLLKRMGMEDLAGSTVSDVRAPMPGLIHSINVEPGREVAKGDVLLILEAMKMENVIKSPSDGVVAKVAVKQGQNVEKGALLIDFQ